MYRRIAIGTVLVALLAPAPVFANFGASDLIYIPVVSYSSGAVGSKWRTDVYVTNVDDTPVDIVLAYLPSGLVDNAWVFYDRANWLGGREDEGFGEVNEVLADIPPNGSIVLRNLIGEYWANILGASGNGALVVFAYEAGTLGENVGERVPKNVIANARIYNRARQWVEDEENEGEFIDKAAWYGQVVPGVPWYNFADGGAVTEEIDLSYQVLTGGQEGGGLRFNVGVVNASDPLTTLTVRVQPYQADGEPFLDENELEIASLITMPPASHYQLFRPFREIWDINAAEGATVKVSIVGWSSNAASPRPMMTSYGSVIANNTGDPSTVVPFFADPYDVECMWGGEEAALKGAQQRTRPVDIPAVNRGD